MQVKRLMNLNTDGTTIRRENIVCNDLYVHFNLPGYSGFIKNVSDVSEYCWIHILKIKPSLGLNVKDGLQAQIIVFFFTDYVYERTVFE